MNLAPWKGIVGGRDPEPGGGPSLAEAPLREAMRDVARLEALALERNVREGREEVERVQDLVGEGARTLGFALRSLDLKVQGQYQRVLAVQEASLWVVQGQGAQDSPDSQRMTAGVLETLDSLMSNMVGITESIRGVLAGVEEVQALSDRMERNLGELAEIASRTSLLSLNANIEAAHARQFGAGFAVVAGEVSKLATRSTDLSDAIQGLIRETRQALERTGDQVRSLVAHDLHLAMASKERAESVVKAIDASSAKVRDQVAELRRSAEEIETQVGNVVRGIQFDDLARQALGQVHRVFQLLEARASAWRQCERALAGDSEDPARILARLAAELGEAEARADRHLAVTSRDLVAGEVDLF
jgi:methyl-accepting chemotaxis protein